MIPRELGKYTLLEHMGTGSVGSVYRATDNEAGTVVALKLFEPVDRPADLMRKLRDREVRMLVGVQHPNVVKFFGSGEIDNCFYYTMEFVENTLLKHVRDGKDFELADKIHILRQTVNALQAMHHQGIVHRDIKPGNILLDVDENGALHVKVTDLGIAKHVSETDVARDDSRRRVPGTPKYLSPEQIQFRPVDGRTDIFSLGVVAYEMLCGQPPVRGHASDDFVKGNLHVEARLIHHVNPDLPPFLSQLVAKMLQRDRQERYDSDTLGRDLELTYQHLVSNAPLVDQTNPASIFYVPPAPRLQQAPTVAAAPKRTVSLYVWAAACAIALVGIALTAFLWPQAPEMPLRLPQPDLAEPLPRTAEDALRDAKGLVESEHYWQVFVLLRSLAPDRLTEDQKSRRTGLLALAGKALAEADFEAASRMLAQGRAQEAQIVLLKLREYWPDAPAVRRLEELMARLSDAAARKAEWEAWVASVDGKLKRGEYAQVLKEAEGYLGDPHPAPDGRARLQGIVTRCFESWGAALLRGRTVPARFQEYLEDLERHVLQGDLTGEFKDVSGELCLRLGEFYRSAGQYDMAARSYERVIARYPGPLAQRATVGLNEIDRAMLREPMDIGGVSRELAKSGFAAGIWRQDDGQGGRQKLEDGELLIGQRGDLTEQVTVRETARPILSSGFRAAVKQRVQTVAPQPRRSEVGLEVQDKDGNNVRFSFDGLHYNLSRSFTQEGRRISGGSSVAGAFGDEADQWHELALRYNFATRQVVAYLDGKSVGEYQGEIGAFRLRVFVQVLGAGECVARFKDVAVAP